MGLISLKGVEKGEQKVMIILDIMIVFVLQSVAAYKHIYSRSGVFKFHEVEAIRKKVSKKAPECGVGGVGVGGEVMGPQ